MEALSNPITLDAFPAEILAEIFSNLDPASIGQNARVCQLFKRISELNQVWKPVHLRYWQIPEPWIGPKPQSWKVHAQKMDRAYDARPSIDFNDSMTKLFYHYLKLGFLNETLRSVSRDEYSYPDFLFQLYILHGETEHARELVGEGNLEISPEMEILIALEENEREKAYNLYKKYRETFITKNPIIGWWICEILMSEKVTIFKNFQLFPPKIAKRTHFDFLIASAMIWLQRGLEQRAQYSLECLVKTLEHSTLKENSRKELSVFLKFFSEAIVERNALLSLPPRLYRALAQLFKKGSTNCSTLLTNALRRGIETSPDLQARIDLVNRLLHLLKMNSSYTIEEFQLACLPVSVLKEAVDAGRGNPFPLMELFRIADLVLFYDIDFSYQFISKILYRYYPEKNAEIRVAQKYFDTQIQLHRRLNQYQQAIATWLTLHNIEQGSFDLIYSILNESNDACRFVLNMRYPLDPIIQAYAHYTLQEYLQVTSILEKHPDSIDEPWIDELFHTNLAAAIIFSRSFASEEELEEFYMDMLDYHHDDRYLIFHNLAACLYLKGFPEKALESIENAIDECPNQPLSHLIRGLAFEQLGEKEESEMDLKKAYDLDPKNFPLEKRNYTDKDLLIIIRDASLFDNQSRAKEYQGYNR